MKLPWRHRDDRGQQRTYRELMAIRTQVAAYLSTALAAMDEPVDGSTLRADLDHFSALGREDLKELALEIRKHVGDAIGGPAAEYSGGLAAALAPDPTYEHPALSMSRSLMEIGMTVHWLITDGVDTQVRLARWAGAELAAIQGALEIYESMDLQPAIGETRDRLRNRQRELQDLGFHMVFKGPPRKHEVRCVRFGAALEPVQPKFVDLARIGGEQSTVAYALLSGATHSRAWFVAQSGAPAATVRATAAGQVAWVWSGVLHQVQQYTGADASHVRQALFDFYGGLFAEAGTELGFLVQNAQNPFANRERAAQSADSFEAPEQ